MGNIDTNLPYDFDSVDIQVPRKVGNEINHNRWYRLIIRRESGRYKGTAYRPNSNTDIKTKAFDEPSLSNVSKYHGFNDKAEHLAREIEKALKGSRSSDEQLIKIEPAPEKTPIYSPPEESSNVKLSTFLSLCEYFQQRGFSYTHHQIATFYTALRTKGFVILSGLSGTGKSKIAQLLAELLNEEDGERNCFMAVRPDWRDSKSLIGYYNPLLGKYHTTSLTRLLSAANASWWANLDTPYHKAHPEDIDVYFVTLDEMNLARVEYYFSDFLSIMESGRDDIERWTKEPLRLHSFEEPIEAIDEDGKVEAAIYLPPNIYFVGTVNVDETTHMFSPKVLDRAFTIEFADVDLSGYVTNSAGKIVEPDAGDLRHQILSDLYNKGKHVFMDKTEILGFAASREGSDYTAALVQLNEILESHELHFGYRVFDEIMMFLLNAKNSFSLYGFRGSSNAERLHDAFDSSLLMKVLPKFHGPVGRMQEPLLETICWSLGATGEADKNDVKSYIMDNKANLVLQIQTLSNGLNEMSADELELELNNNIFAYAYPRMALKALKMLKKLHETGYTSFA